MENYEIIAIWCRQKKGGIGLKKKILYTKDDLPNDMARFIQLSKGNPVIMGRKTMEGLFKFPLPNRENIILTKHPESIRKFCEQQGKLDALPGLQIFTHADLVLPWAVSKFPEKKIVIMGGSEIYTMYLPYCKYIFSTDVDFEKKADAFIDFPASFKLTEKQDQPTGPTGINYSFATYENMALKPVIIPDGTGE